jgi:hypothetical protein
MAQSLSLLSSPFFLGTNRSSPWWCPRAAGRPVSALIHVHLSLSHASLFVVLLLPPPVAFRVCLLLFFVSVSPAISPDSKTTLFVANLPFSTEDEDLANLFAGLDLMDAHVVTRRTGRSKGGSLGSFFPLFFFLFFLIFSLLSN